jgi:hypothetical protein
LLYLTMAAFGYALLASPVSAPRPVRERTSEPMLVAR